MKLKLVMEFTVHLWGHILGIFGQKVEINKVLFAEVRGPVLL